eukprot:COSAG02_NODE_2919_length_7748_cov_39.701660_2_plen_1471_part_00
MRDTINIDVRTIRGRWSGQEPEHTAVPSARPGGARAVACGQRCRIASNLRVEGTDVSGVADRVAASASQVATAAEVNTSRVARAEQLQRDPARGLEDEAPCPRPEQVPQPDQVVRATIRCCELDITEEDATVAAKELRSAGLTHAGLRGSVRQNWIVTIESATASSEVSEAEISSTKKNDETVPGYKKLKRRLGKAIDRELRPNREEPVRPTRPELPRVDKIDMSVAQRFPLVDVAVHLLLRRGMAAFEDSLDRISPRQGSNGFVKESLERKFGREWEQKAQECVGKSMKEYVTATNSWDAYTLAKVMHGQSEVFVELLPRQEGLPAGGDRGERVAGLARLTEVLTRRNDAAHSGGLTVEEVVSCLSSAQSWLESFPSFSSMTTGAKTLREQHQLLLDLKAGRTSEVTAEKYEIRSMIALMAIADFESRLRPVIKKAGGDATDATTMSKFLKKNQQTLGKGIQSEWLERAHFENDGTRPMGIVDARNWLHHRGGQSFDACVVDILDKVLDKVASNSKCTGISVAARPWSQLMATLGAESDLKLTIQHDTHAPTASTVVHGLRNLVGREEDIDAVAEKLKRSGSKVLIHGLPGVGKDVTAAAVLDRQEIAGLGGIRKWLYAGTDAALAEELIKLGVDHMGVEPAAEQESKLQQVRSWLKSHPEGWLLMLEDVADELETLEKWLPTGVGRVLMTSQHPLHRVMAGITYHHELAVFTADQAKELWMREPFPISEDQLASTVVDKFLEDKLGMLPLSVDLCGWLMKAQNLTVEELVREFDSVDLDDIDRKGMNRQQRQHALGVSGSVRLALARLRKSKQYSKKQKTLAEDLLQVLAMVAEPAPLEIFDCSPDEWHCGIRKPARCVFCRPAFEDAQRVLVEFGLVRQTASDSAGRCHQLVQQCVREFYQFTGKKKGPSDDHPLRLFVKVLNSRLKFSLLDRRHRLDGMPVWRRLLPCVRSCVHNDAIKPHMQHFMTRELCELFKDYIAIGRIMHGVKHRMDSGELYDLGTVLLPRALLLDDAEFQRLLIKTCPCRCVDIPWYLHMCKVHVDQLCAKKKGERTQGLADLVRTFLECVPSLNSDEKTPEVSEAVSECIASVERMSFGRVVPVELGSQTEEEFARRNDSAIWHTFDAEMLVRMDEWELFEQSWGCKQKLIPSIDRLVEMVLRAQLVKCENAHHPGARDDRKAFDWEGCPHYFKGLLTKAANREQCLGYCLIRCMLAPDPDAEWRSMEADLDAEQFSELGAEVQAVISGEKKAHHAKRAGISFILYGFVGTIQLAKQAFDRADDGAIHKVAPVQVEDLYSQADLIVHGSRKGPCSEVHRLQSWVTELAGEDNWRTALDKLFDFWKRMHLFRLVRDANICCAMREFCKDEMRQVEQEHVDRMFGTKWTEAIDRKADERTVAGMSTAALKRIAKQTKNTHQTEPLLHYSIDKVLPNWDQLLFINQSCEIDTSGYKGVPAGVTRHDRDNGGA